MSNKVYDIISKLQRWLPALGVFYLALGEIWNVPVAQEVNATIVALATLLAASLEVATNQYNKRLQ